MTSEFPLSPSPALPRALWVVVLGVVALDQLTKWIVSATMDLHQSLAVLGDWVRLTYIRNPGGAFGLRWGHVGVYYVSAAIVILWISWHLCREGRTRRLSIWALALILGGAIGNLVDRLSHGDVIDFLDVDFFDMRIPAFDLGILRHPGYLMDRWPTFNVADSAVTIGVVILLVTLWRDPVFGGQGTADQIATEGPTVDGSSIPSLPIGEDRGEMDAHV